MSKYETMYCRGFFLPDDPTAKTVAFMDVVIAKGSWDEIEDADDQHIFYYMDGYDLAVGDIIADDFVITEIEEVKQ